MCRCVHYPYATFLWRALTYVIHSWPAGQIHSDSGTRLGCKLTPLYILRYMMAGVVLLFHLFSSL